MKIFLEHIAVDLFNITTWKKCADGILTVNLFFVFVKLEAEQTLERKKRKYNMRTNDKRGEMKNRGVNTGDATRWDAQFNSSHLIK
ncbi:hypothetical protein POVCU2_0037130 [Plasmodium ovale curtisi]|uniref:Uncharacterized protein n=1 Tax=Plasmodium ovale curtisi TaxID=864141 RepID=A0A1A8W376_PLAOA|nr:hypothetical protein POVCU2_0037130 [Plasmodium ovale curtisi]SBS96848.1 hypothetical protein POVCU1_034240 [Plasmodium ovale curtisi]